MQSYKKLIFNKKTIKGVQNMGKITYDLLPKQKSRKNNLMEEIDIYPLATELYDELDHIGIISRIKEVPQLGVIKVSKKLAKTRYDYVMLQLYLHQLIKKHLQDQLRLTYNNTVNAKEFRADYTYNDKKFKPSIGDILQILTIIYNMGHFYNTFTASRAVTMMSSEDKSFCEMIINASNNERYKVAVKKILEDKNYQRLHLLNSILILEKCDQTKLSVTLGLEILFAYINEEELSSDSKLNYIFSIFRNVRTISYMAYDLQIANTPLTIDLCNKEAMCMILKELLSEYNNNQSSNDLVKSISKLLDDTVYNENSNAICYYKISRKMVSLLSNIKSFSDINFYNELFISRESVLNRLYSHKRDYIQSHILKLTFNREERVVAFHLLSELEKINNTRVGYYDRHSGELTILVSIKHSCDYHAKKIASFKTLRYVVNSLRSLPLVYTNDTRFLLVTKFFLYYLFAENPVVIKPTIDREKCVICTRGKNSRKNEIAALLSKSVGTRDENHEVHYLLDQLKKDEKNDTSITVPASILVYQKEAIGKKLCEFDGIIIHPMRHENQLIFLEAKNTSNKPAYGKNCLKRKLDLFPIYYSADDISIDNFDAHLEYSI